MDSLMDLFVRIGVDTSEYDNKMPAATQQASMFGDTFKAILSSNVIMKVFDMAVEGAMRAAQAFSNLVKESVNLYSEYEQLVGGVQTIFKNASDTVIQNAQNAYKTAGMSANQYMDNVMVFSTTLLNSIGRSSNKMSEETIAKEQAAIDKSLANKEKAYDRAYNAAKRSYDKEYQSLSRSLDKQISDYEKATDKKIKLIDKEYTENMKLVDEDKYNQLKAVQDKIDALNDETEAEQDALDKREQANHIADLEERIRNAKSLDERAEAQRDLDDYRLSLTAKANQKQRAEQIESLQKEQEAINDAADKKKEALREQRDNEVEQVRSSAQDQLEIMRQSKEDQLTALRDSNNAKLQELKAGYDEQLKLAKQAAKEQKAALTEETGTSAKLTAEQYEEAAKVADMALKDMADNHNKLGTDMEMIQNAYRGFSMQNYRMLDNLRLGYGGTKTEMERLLKDAEKLSGVHYDIDNLADVYKAIHEIQKNLDITGTTAEEAEHTISGSIAQLKAAWENLKIGFGDPNADIEQLVNNVVDAAETVFDNVLPTVERIIIHIADALEDLMPIIEERLPVLLDKLQPAIESIVGSLFRILGTLIMRFIPILMDGSYQTLMDWVNKMGELHPVLGAIVGYFAFWPTVISGIISGHFDDFVSALNDGISSILETLWNAASSVIDAIVYPFKTAYEFVVGIFDNIKSAFTDGWNMVANSGSFGTPTTTWHAKGYTTPLLFKKPTILPTVAGLQGFGELGGDGEIVYGRQNLMDDMEEVLNGTTDEISVITSGNEGTRDLNIILQLDRQTFARAVYHMNQEETQRVGVQLAGGYA